MEVINVKRELEKQNSIKTRNTLLIILFTVLWLGLTSLLMLTAKRDAYIVNLIFTILVNVIYFFFLIFYIFILRKENKANLRLLNGAYSNSGEEIIGVVKSIENEIKTYNDLEYFVITIEVKDNYKNTNRRLYIPINNVNQYIDKKVKIYCFNSVVISLEETR